MRTAFLFLFLAASLAAQAPAALKRFMASPAASVSQNLGISSVKIDYASPAVKGRTIWGGVVPYGQVWRAGANEATVITFSDPVKIDGKAVPAGSYAFFAIPGPQTWTLILNRQPRQWGAIAYKAADDVLRWTVKPVSVPHPQERLQFTAEAVGTERLRITLSWDKLALAFDAELDAKGVYLAYIRKAIEEAPAEHHLPTLLGALFCWDQQLDLAQGQAWAERSFAIKPHYRSAEVLARFAQKGGRAGEARAHLAKARELAVAAKVPAEYLAELDQLQASLATP